MTEIPAPPSSPPPLSSRMGLGRKVLVALQYPFALIAFALLWLSCLFDRALPLPLPFPRSPQKLAKRPGWCVATLARAGALPAGVVPTRFEVRPFKRGEVFRSTLAEIELDYEHDGRTHSFACVAKFSAQFGTITQQVISIMQRNALNEIQLYRALGDGTDPGVLRVYYARVAGLAGRFLILLERVDPAIQLTEEAGAPIETAREVASFYARFHARHWRSEHASARRPRVPLRVPGAAIDFACSLAWGRMRRISRQFARASWHYGNRAQTIVHGDARVRNLVFRARTAGGHPADPVFIDWQATRWGLGVYDLAYFTLLSLAPETRAAHERELVERYFAELVAHGVADYPLAALWDDYRHSVLLVFSLLFLPLLGGEQTLDDDNRAAATSVAMAWHERVLCAIERFDHAWVAERYAIDTSDFIASATWIANHPHPLNSGARLVAAELARRRAADD